MKLFLLWIISKLMRLTFSFSNGGIPIPDCFNAFSISNWLQLNLLNVEFAEIISFEQIKLIKANKSILDDTNFVLLS
jgi:hypothetical protein